MKISWVSKKVKAQNSKISGRGAFAVKDITAAELVTVFGGFIAHFDDLKILKKQNLKTYETIVSIGYQVSDKLVYAPTSSSQFSDMEYLNHSCDPNCGFVSQIELIAIRNIPVGEELTMDYGLCISNPIFEMPCTCGKLKCRTKITANDWKNLILQKKLGKYFQPYLKEKFREYKSA